MKKLLIFFTTFSLLSLTSHAENAMKPGLWEVSFKIKTDGKVIKPAEQIKKSLAKLSPEDQEQMKAALKERAGIEEDGTIKVCYSAADIQLQEATISPMGEDCLSKVIESNNTKVITNFVCLNGFTGSSTRFIKGPHKYKGVTKVVSPVGDVSEIIYRGKFFSPLCDNEMESVEI